MKDDVAKKVSELPKITVHSDTRDILAHAAQQSKKYSDYFIVDVDAHVAEASFWGEIVNRIDSDVYKHMAKSFEDRRNQPGLSNEIPGLLYQDVFGRIPHAQSAREKVDDGEVTHRQIVLMRRAMDSMGIDYTVVFPTPMLVLGMHPQVQVEVEVGKAFNEWLIHDVLPQDARVKALLYLPFNDPVACEKLVERHSDTPGVIGFSVTSTRFKPVYHNDYMRLYSAIEASGKPLSFHSGYHWGDQSMQQCNTFMGMHALSFVHFNMLHLTNWVLNGLPERFKKLKVIWIESGLAWVPFIMQRLDSEYMMRTSEAPLLKRKPSEYIQDMFFTSQPLERSNMKLTEATFEAMRAETQVLYASDWPHWDFDLPTSITTLPFLDEQAKRNILGLNASKLFGIPPKKVHTPVTRQPARV